MNDFSHVVPNLEDLVFSNVGPLFGTGGGRPTDELTDTGLTEVKNVASLSYTSQLRDFYWYANYTGRSFNLVVRASMVLSSRLQAMVDAGAVNLNRMLPGP
jgi:Restriction endonuclease fold toxin 7